MSKLKLKDPITGSAVKRQDRVFTSVTSSGSFEYTNKEEYEYGKNVIIKNRLTSNNSSDTVVVERLVWLGKFKYYDGTNIKGRLDSFIVGNDIVTGQAGYSEEEFISILDSNEGREFKGWKGWFNMRNYWEELRSDPNSYLKIYPRYDNDQISVNNTEYEIEGTGTRYSNDKGSLDQIGAGKYLPEGWQLSIFGQNFL